MSAFAPGQYTTSKGDLKSLGKKVNLALQIGIKQMVEEYDWQRDFPREKITMSQNENWFPVVLKRPGNVAAIPEFGYEAVATTPAPVEGKFMPVQLNKRFAFSILAEAFDRRARGGYVENQLAYQAMEGIYAIAHTVGLQFYGTTTGVIALVKTTGSATTPGTPVSVPLKDAYGSNLVSGSTLAQQQYFNLMIPEGEGIALIRAGVVVGFGVVTASDASTAPGEIMVDFGTAITPTANDQVVFANAVTDTTINGTDYNLWPVGFFDVFFSDTVHGISRSTQSNWRPGHEGITPQRMSFQVKERAITDIFNASGQKADMYLMSQGVRIDAIAGELGARRYDSAKMDLEGDLVGRKYLTSQRVPPGFAMYWQSQAYTKVDLSEQPSQGSQERGIYEPDKVQDRNGYMNSFNFIRANIIKSRAATGYDANLAEL